MNFIFLQRFARCLALIASISSPAFAAEADAVSDSAAVVPTIAYQSVFRATSLGVELEKADWRKANDDVGKFTRGHVDILKQEEMDSKAMQPKPAAPAPLKP